MRAEKKITVGNAWNARKNPRDVSPVSFVVPGGRASLPKTNRVPAEADSRTLMTTSLMKRKTFVPKGTTNINTAKKSWSPMPHTTSRQFIFFLSGQISQTKPSNTKMPEKLTKLYGSIAVYYRPKTKHISQVFSKHSHKQSDVGCPILDLKKRLAYMKLNLLNRWAGSILIRFFRCLATTDEKIQVGKKRKICH